MKSYLKLLKAILDHGEECADRTGTGTFSLLGRTLKHDLKTGFPLLTTKKVHFKSIAHELIWFLRGDTNIKYLKDNGVSIWDEWANEEGELGPLYGTQWVKWPTKNGGEINQIENLITALKNNPYSRRHIFHAWNVEYLPDESVSPRENASAGKMALPPCHLLYQFFVRNDGLHALLTIRSGDYMLGSPFNLASLALLTHMLSEQCGYEAATVQINYGDVHIYKNHIKQAELQLTRTPKKLPEIVFVRKPASIFEYQYEDFYIENYHPEAAIKAKVAV